MDSVLRRLQQVLRSSRGGAKWTSAFVALLGLAMCFEEVQRTAHANQDADALMGQMDERDATQSAEAACRCIDEKFQFMANLFRWKYHRGFNPLKDYEDPKVRETLSDSSLLFVRSVAALVQEKCESACGVSQCIIIANIILHRRLSSRQTACTDLAGESGQIHLPPGCSLPPCILGSYPDIVRF